MENVTAATIYKEGGITVKNKTKINRLIFTCYHLSTLQNNFFQEIEDILKDGAGYRLEVKHNHKRIKSLLQQGLNLSNIWMKAEPVDIKRFCEDAELLEKMVRKFANIEPSDVEKPQISIDEITLRSYESALKRGKITESTSLTVFDEEYRNGISTEYLEYCHASHEKQSEHLPSYTEDKEEIADITLVCLTELYRRGVNIQQILVDKLIFNENRK